MKLYPSELFYKFGSSPNSYIPHDSEIDMWVKSCITTLENDKNKHETLRGTGNTKVFVQRFYYEESEDSDYYYEVTVCKNYEEAMIEREQFEQLK